MSIPQEPSPKSPERPPPKAKLFQTLAVEHAPEFRRLCLAVLCERWAAFMLMPIATLMGPVIARVMGPREGIEKP